MLKPSTLLAALVAVVFLPSAAYAHGEEVLVFPQSGLLALVLAGPFILVRPAKWHVKIGLGFALVLAVGLAWAVGVGIAAAGFSWREYYFEFAVGMGIVGTLLSALPTWFLTRGSGCAFRLSKQSVLIPVFIGLSVLLLEGLSLLARGAGGPLDARRVAGAFLGILMFAMPVWIVGCAAGFVLGLAAIFRGEARRTAIVGLVLNAVLFGVGCVSPAEANRLAAAQAAIDALALERPTPSLDIARSPVAAGTHGSGSE